MKRPYFVFVQIITMISASFGSLAYATLEEEAIQQARQEVKQRYFENLKASILFGNPTLKNPELHLARSALRGAQRAEYQIMKHPVSGIPNALVHQVMTFLEPASFASIACTNQDFYKVSRNSRLQFQIRENAFRKLLGNFIELPAVTAEEAQRLQKHLPAGDETSIQGPISAFKISEAAVSIGRYKAVMGNYPDITEEPWATQSNLRRQWKAKSDLPVVYVYGVHEVPQGSKLDASRRLPTSLTPQLSALFQIGSCFGLL